ncbi:hypothetical protein HDU88_006310 [Geranomyces variabilis]|nr:hypothetical protein HDU88_006310 [Geranomyces variabilis]
MPQKNEHDLFPSDSDELSDCGVSTDSSWSDTLKLIVREERKRKPKPTPKGSADAETLHNATAKTKSDSTAKVTAVKSKTTTAKAAATTKGKRKKVKNEENCFEKEYDKWAIRYDYDVMKFMFEFKKHHPSHQLPQALDQFVSKSLVGALYRSRHWRGKRILNKNVTRPLNDHEIAIISKLLAKVRITLDPRRSGRHRYTINKVGNVAADKNHTSPDDTLTPLDPLCPPT